MKVISGVAQYCWFIRRVFVDSVMLDTMKHHGAAYLLIGIVVASGAPTAGLGIESAVAIAELSFWTVSLASGR